VPADYGTPSICSQLPILSYPTGLQYVGVGCRSGHEDDFLFDGRVEINPYQDDEGQFAVKYIGFCNVVLVMLLVPEDFCGCSNPLLPARFLIFFPEVVVRYGVPDLRG